MHFDIIILLKKYIIWLFWCYILWYHAKWFVFDENGACKMNNFLVRKQRDAHTIKINSNNALQGQHFIQEITNTSGYEIYP